MRRGQYFAWFAVVVTGLAIAGATVSRAGEVTSVGLWLNRYQEGGAPTHYGFYSDVWGTVEEFDSIILTSPLPDTYALSPAPEGDQWSYDQEGTQAEIEAEFGDGMYTFDVTYTDTSSEQISVELGGTLPAFPANVEVGGGQVTWDSWVSPVDPHGIAVEIEDTLGTQFVSAELLPTATSYIIPGGFVEDGSSYEVWVYFISSAHASSYKASVSIELFHAVIADVVRDTIRTNTKWITWHIRPPDGYDVTDIDLDSIRLEGSILPVRTSVRRKKQMLVVKFPASEIGLTPTPERVLTVTGALTDGTVFEGSDSVAVVEKGRNPG